MQVGRSHNTVMVRRVVLGEIVTEVSAAGFPTRSSKALYVSKSVSESFINVKLSCKYFYF